MEHRSVNGYIFMGTCVRYLMHAQAGFEIHAEGGVVGNLTELRQYLQNYEFHVTERVGHASWSLLEKWGVDSVDADGDTVKLSPEEAQVLWSSAANMRETMLAEAAGKRAFIATDKRYTVSKLMSDIPSLMAPGVYDALPPLAQADFSDGAKAIAFDLPTAAAFHVLRGTEAVLRDFYLQVQKRNRISEPRMWAAIVADLRGKRNPPPKLLLDNLDSLRRNFRNPTQHPEKTYDDDEAQDLLALAIDSVNRMTRHLQVA